jgi:antitoxin HicB
MGTARFRKKDQENPQIRAGSRGKTPQAGRKTVSRAMRPRHRHCGSSLDELLDSEGVRAQFELVAIKEVIAWQVAQTMKGQKLTKAAMAVLMGTSRAQLDRLLDPQRDVTLSTLSRAATALGRQLRVTLA